MRPSFTLTFLYFGLSLIPFSSASTLISSDVCVNLNAALTVPGLLGPITLGKIEECLCISTVPNFCETNVLAVAASVLAGKNAVIDIIEDLINSHSPQECYYPANALPACLSGNPCAFDCQNGFAYSPPNECVCNPPFSSCNGKCVAGPCPSANLKREAVETPNLAKRNQVCPIGQTPCGVLGRGQGSWECVDTHSDLESCGGCLLPLPFNLGQQPIGQDCTAIPGVSDVSCAAGACVVHRCMPGFTVGLDGSSCLPVARDNEYRLKVAEWM